MKNTGTLVVTTPSPTEIQMVRVFDAPKSLVWDALIRPELVRRWFGPRGHHLVVCEIDLRVGGAWRYVIRSPEGHDMGMRGTYREIAPPDALVWTESFDDYPMGEAQNRLQLVEAGGKTTMTVVVRAPSQEVRDAIIASGMEHGAAETYDRLNELVAH